MDRSNETMQRYLSDMIAVVRHVHEAVERQKSDERVAKMQDVKELLQRIYLTLDTQMAGLRRQYVAIGGDSGSSVKEVVASTLGQAAGIIGMVRPDKVSLMLRDDYTALNMTAIAYTMLHTTALALHDEVTGEVAVNYLKEITPLVIEINEVIPHVVMMELMDEAEVVDMSMVNHAIQGTQSAWQHEHVHMGHDHQWEQRHSEDRDASSRPMAG